MTITMTMEMLDAAKEYYQETGEYDLYLDEGDIALKLSLAIQAHYGKVKLGVVKALASQVIAKAIDLLQADGYVAEKVLITREFNRWAKEYNSLWNGKNCSSWERAGMTAFMCNAIACAVQRSNDLDLKEYFDTHAEQCH